MRRFSRRTFIAWVGGAGAGFYLFGRLPGLSAPAALAQVPGGTLDPTAIEKFETPLLIPPAMPKAGTVVRGGVEVDDYEISMKQFAQQILPAGLPATTVWGYGAVRSALWARGQWRFHRMREHLPRVGAPAEAPPHLGDALTRLLGRSHAGRVQLVASARQVATVLIVDKDDKVAERVVTADRAINGEWLITAGLAPGDRVIVDGLQKAKPGSLVKAVPAAEEMNADLHAGGTANEVAKR